jgi:NAD(P) transhydrogenase subunit alpha
MIAAAGLLIGLTLMGAPGCGPSETAPTKPAATDTTAATNPVAANPAPAEASPPAALPGPPNPASLPPAVPKPGVANPTEAAAPAEPTPAPKVAPVAIAKPATEPVATQDYSSLLFVFMLATFIGLGVVLRVSRLLHTPLMSLTNAISAIAVVGSIIVLGEGNNPWGVRLLGAIALFCSMTNIVSGFLITDRMLKMFKSPGEGGKR